MGDHPYLTLIEAEAGRAEADLTGFRDRALTVVTTSAGVVTLLTGLVTFAASKDQKDAAIPKAAIWLVGLALAAFVAAALCALRANMPGTIQRPGGGSLTDCTKQELFTPNDTDNTEFEMTRYVAKILATYVVSLREIADSTATWLTRATKCQIVGLVLASVATVVTLASL